MISSAYIKEWRQMVPWRQVKRPVGEELMSGMSEK
jgi:hypothetical protein